VRGVNHSARHAVGDGLEAVARTVAARSSQLSRTPKRADVQARTRRIDARSGA